MLAHACPTMFYIGVCGVNSVMFSLYIMFWRTLDWISLSNLTNPYSMFMYILVCADTFFGCISLYDFSDVTIQCTNPLPLSSPDYMTYIICKSSIQTSVRMKCLGSITLLHVSHSAVCMDGCNFVRRCAKKWEEVGSHCLHTHKSSLGNTLFQFTCWEAPYEANAGIFYDSNGLSGISVV